METLEISKLLGNKKRYLIDVSDKAFKKFCKERGFAPASIPDFPIAMFVKGYYESQGSQLAWCFSKPRAYYIPLSGQEKLRVEPLSAQAQACFDAYGPSSVSSTGWDPEIFAVDANDQVIPAFFFLPGKTNPVALNPAASLKGSGFMYNDGFQAEFTTPGKVSCHGWGFDQIQAGLRDVLRAARKHDPQAKLTTKNFFEIPNHFMQMASSEQVELGCQPSLNAYNTDPFEPGNPFEFRYRMAGGHVHLGMGNLKPEVAPQVVKTIDWLVALPAVGMFANIDDPRRRQFYGRAGEYRLPKHGLEYRTLSSAWLGHPAVGHLLMDWVRYGTTPQMVSITPDSLGTSEEEIRDIINTCDVHGARRLFERNIEIWRVLSGKTYGGGLHSDKRMQAIVMEGVESKFPTYNDVEANWKLTGHWGSHTDESRGTWSANCQNA